MMHKLELDVGIPPLSTVTAKFTVEKGHLKWDEYPPDANHGFYLPAARFEVNVTSDTKPTETKEHIYYSRILLINLSTPDFSMPYNVICLTCTVVALAFGPIHNITTKRLQLKVKESKQDKFRKILDTIKSKFSKAEEPEQVAESTEEQESDIPEETDST